MLRYFFITLYSLIFSNFSFMALASEPGSPKALSNIASPISGERHLPYQQIKQHFEDLAQNKAQIKLFSLGQSHEQRGLFISAISSEKNLNLLAQYQSKKENIFNLDSDSDSELKANNELPLFIWLSYAIHGDEAAGAHSAVKLAQQLSQTTNPKIKSWLEQAVIFIEPVQNPDGYDRYVTWVNRHHSLIAVSDPQHIEHQQGWLKGRGNHYWFDLNRDWLLLSQPESQARVSFYQRYKPNVLADFHEMSAKHSYFFQPGIQSRVNPYINATNKQLTKKITQSTASMFDQKNTLYFTEERFDDFYIGKGSTYPDLQGGIGLLYEQGSPRGLIQESPNGLISFKHAIENQYNASLSLIEGAINNKDALINYQRDFFKKSADKAKKEKHSGYLLAPSNIKGAMPKLLALLSQHQIKAFALSKDLKHQGEIYPAEKSYWIPLQQKQYYLIKSIFSTQTRFENNHFYDVSNWNLALANNIKATALKEGMFGINTAKKAWQEPVSSFIKELSEHDYAWLISWQQANAPALVAQALRQGLKIKVASQPFTATVKKGQQKNVRNYKAGALLISPRQQNSAAQASQILNSLAKKLNVNIEQAQSGLTSHGIDLGSSFFHPLTPIKAAIIVGDHVNTSEVGEVWHHFDTNLKLPLSQLNYAHLGRFDLNRYSHLIMVNSNKSPYSYLNSSQVKQIKQWLAQGGTLLAQKNAAQWASKNALLNNHFLSTHEIKQQFSSDGLSYNQKSYVKSQMRIAGSVFQAKFDLSHPLSFGLEHEFIPLLKNKLLVMEQSDKPFLDVAIYSDSPLLAGYASDVSTNLLTQTTALTSQAFGKGKVIAWTDNLLFRAYWHGSSRIFDNALLLSPAIKF